MPVTADNQYLQAEAKLEELAAAFRAGESVNALAKKYGLRREAISTVLMAAGVTESTDGRERVLEYVREHRGKSVDDLAEELGIPKSTVSRYLRGTDEQKMVVTRKKSDYTTYTDSFKIQALQQAWKLLTVDQRSKGLSRTKYDELLGKRSDMPSSVTFVRRYGSWSEACEAAGISASVARRSSYEREFSDEDIVAAVDRFTRETGETNFHAYAAWAKESGEASGPLVIIRLGSWSEARRAAIELAAESA